jgi:ketosteroid isomerase-like protein
MKRLFIMATAAVLLLPSQAVAQGRPIQPPSELQETWPRVADAWKRGSFQHLASDLTPDFALLVPTASFQGREAVEADWHNARSRSGSVYLPGRFTRDGDRILETGRAQLLFAVATSPFDDEPMCSPEAGYQAQPVSYLREWVRTPDGSWKVKSLVLQ